MLYKCPTHDINSHQKWHDGSSSNNIDSSSNSEGITAIVSKLDNLGRDIKKLKENVHAIQVGCQLCEGAHIHKESPLNEEVKSMEEGCQLCEGAHIHKECPLNEEVKSMEEGKYGEFGRPFSNNSRNDCRFNRGVSGYDQPSSNIPEEDAETKQLILDPDDQPMWESAKTITPTPNSAIIRSDVDENFVINSTHLKMIQENKFDGYLRAEPHDHIHEFLAICDMFKYGETQSEAVKLLIFPISLYDEAKIWFIKLNEESITSNFFQNVCESLTDAWLRLRNMLQKCHGNGLTKGAIIQISYHDLDESTQAILDGTAGGIFLYKTPNQAFQLEKVLFKLYWSIKSKIEHHQTSVAFSDGSNNDNSR
nr:reverse transcriptase domain-containing protein [Tanacetum cinerariifolium]